LADASVAIDFENACEEGRSIVFVDESGFYMSPTVAKTWSPAGRKPQLIAPFTRTHLSVIGGVTLDGGLYIQVHDSSIGAHGAVQFVAHLLRYLPGRLLLLWDRSRSHTSAELEEFRKLDTIDRLKIEYFPPYAPEIDPQEYVWRHLKHVELRNLTSHSLDDLWDNLRQAIKRLRARAALLRRFAHHAGLDTGDRDEPWGHKPEFQTSLNVPTIPCDPRGSRSPVVTAPGRRAFSDPAENEGMLKPSISRPLILFNRFYELRRSKGIAIARRDSLRPSSDIRIARAPHYSGILEA
jgi:transposase